DAHPVAGTWSRRLPDGILAELRQADYVVDVHNYWDSHLGEEILRDLDFTPVAGVSLDQSCYRIWRRRTADCGRGRAPHGLVPVQRLTDRDGGNRRRP